LAQKPAELDKHYYDLFVKTLKANIPEYDKIEKRSVTPQATIESLGFDQSGRLIVGTGKAGQSTDFVYFRGPLSVDKADPLVESVARLFAEKLAVTVETLIGHASLRGKVFCTDLFKLTDGSPNLQTFYCVKGNEMTVDDPTGSITGWFAYKLYLTVDTRPTV